MQNLIKKDGYEFSFDPKACLECEGNCCRGESGYIWVNRDEIKKISEFLGLSEDEFIKNCLKKVKYRFTIKEIFVKGEYQCLFFDSEKKRCEIYPVRPTQCRTFPFWDRYKDKKYINEVCKECPGIKL